MGIFGGETKQNVQGPVDTIIGDKAKIKGEINSSGSVSVNGQLEGKLVSSGEIIIGRNSRVTGGVEGGTVIVSGKVEGNISASQSLEITKSGRVHGDLSGGRIMIEEGASYRGKVSVQAAEEKTEEEEEETEIVEEQAETSQSKMF